MRCIEIDMHRHFWLYAAWLTLTWDVLKSDGETNAKERKIRLTLTWDVLKFTKMLVDEPVDVD